MLNYVIYSGSDIGGRAENQDQYAYKETATGLLVVVCDGMGGTQGGKTAARKAVTTVIDDFVSGTGDPVANIVSSIKKANAAIIEEGSRDASLKNMGTTLAALLLLPARAVFFHVGDSRIYHLRKGTILHRTHDHSRVGEMVKRGILSTEQARLSEESNILLRALGTAPEIEVDLEDGITYEKGDRFFLCSDGIWGMIPEEELIARIDRNETPESIVSSLIAAINSEAKLHGGDNDNMTAVLLEATGNSRPGKQPAGNGENGGRNPAGGSGFGPVWLIGLLAILLLCSAGYILHLRGIIASSSSSGQSDPAVPKKNDHPERPDSSRIPPAKNNHPSKGHTEEAKNKVEDAAPPAADNPKDWKEKLNKVIGLNRTEAGKINQLLDKLEQAAKTDTSAVLHQLIKDLKTETGHIPVKME